MNPWEMVRVVGSAIFPRAIHVYQFATACAILTCVAIALNIGPFSSALPSNAAAERNVRIAAAPKASVSLPSWELSAQRYELGSATELAGSSRPFPVAAESWPQSPPVTKIAQAAPATSVATESSQARDAKEKADNEPAVVEAAKNATIIGIWAPNAGTCSARDFSEGTLPTIISADGAWAGETFCMFSSKKPTDTGWDVVAKCTSPKERWTTKVRLSVKDNRLRWTSKRGTQSYTRCAPDVLMAAR